jgi:hypothetical protein
LLHGECRMTPSVDRSVKGQNVEKGGDRQYWLYEE